MWSERYDAAAGQVPREVLGLANSFWKAGKQGQDLEEFRRCESVAAWSLGTRPPMQAMLLTHATGSAHLAESIPIRAAVKCKSLAKPDRRVVALGRTATEEE